MVNDEFDPLKSGKRDKIEILSAIMALTQRPKNRNQILEKVRLNYNGLTKYLSMLKERQLIESFDVMENGKINGQLFQATEKGKKLLAAYCRLLMVIYGKNFLEKASENLAVTCLKHCQDGT